MTVETNDVARGDEVAAGWASRGSTAISSSQLPNALPAAPAAYVQAASSAIPSATMQAAMVSGADMAKADLFALFQGWVKGTRPAPGDAPDEIVWFLSKRATALINTWLNNRKLAALHANGAKLGAIVISRERIEHVRESRSTKDSVGAPGVVELLAGLFIHGIPKYAPHPENRKYPTQLLMFDPAYKAKDSAASGESPVAALQFIGTPVAHLRLETAYWANPGKTKALDAQALRK